jgi:hypothetical protein
MVYNKERRNIVDNIHGEYKMTDDVAILRLQYEILNTPLDQIAAEQNLPVSVLKREAENGNWRVLWPDIPFAPHDPDDPTDQMTLESEQYMDIARKRLKVYSLAKDMLLAHRYLALECSLIEAAQTILDSVDTSNIDAKNIRLLASLYKDMTSGSNLSALASMTLTTDENGIPTVVVRDMSGRGGDL